MPENVGDVSNWQHHEKIPTLFPTTNQFPPALALSFTSGRLSTSAAMLLPLLANYPPSSGLFRWLHDVVAMWDGEDNDYTFWFVSAGMPRRDYRVRVSQRGQKRVEVVVQDAIREYKTGQPVDLGTMENGLREAFDRIRLWQHYSRLHIYEAAPFMEFFIDLLQTVEIYGLKLTGAGEQALELLQRARRLEKYATGSLCEVDELLEELDRRVDGVLLGDAEVAKDVEAVSTSSAWWDFFPTVLPLCGTLHLDVYVQPAHSKEEWTKHKHIISGKEGYQQDDPSYDTAVEAEACPSPT